jgi:hypothetical protein
VVLRNNERNNKANETVKCNRHERRKRDERRKGETERGKAKGRKMNLAWWMEGLWSYFSLWLGGGGVLSSLARSGKGDKIVA